jgi:hypothetical protein
MAAELPDRSRVAGGVTKPIFALATLAVAFLPAMGQAQAQQTFSAYPQPGTLAASPKTTLSFRGGDQAALGEIRVVGSRSGRHSGRWRKHSDGQGVSFVPSKRFAKGEKVTVTTDRTVVNGSGGRYSFEIGHEVIKPLRPVEGPGVGKGATQRFTTRKDLIPPKITMHRSNAGVAPGLVFIAPKGGRGQDGPLILDNEGRTVWFKPTPNRLAMDFRAQTYRGKPVLTWWEGRLITGDGDGVGKIYDDRYRPVKTVRAGNGYTFDSHEFVITPQNTALVLGYARSVRDLRPWGGPNGAHIVDGVVQEIDIATGAVLFEWHAFGNVSPAESYIARPKKAGFEWEYFHVNSIQLLPDGNFIISARNTSGVYKINRATGKIMWRLGGKKSDFKLGPGVRFDWQHDAQLQPDGKTLRIFDNASSPPTRKASRAITVELDEDKMTAKLVDARTHPEKLLAASQGNLQTLPNGNIFVGWGSRPFFSEYSADGKLIFDGELARGNDNYRAYRMPWVGRPSAPPKVVASTRGGKTTATVSWNGATEVAKWELLDGSTVLASKDSQGFETTLAGDAASSVTLRALDASGAELTTTKAVKPR